MQAESLNSHKDDFKVFETSLRGMCASLTRLCSSLRSPTLQRENNPDESNSALHETRFTCFVRRFFLLDNILHSPFSLL